MAVWLGVDVGGPRKRCDVAVVDEQALIFLGARLSAQDIVALAARHRPVLIGVDSPCACAPDGERTRAAERDLRRTVCGIRWTPDAAAVASGSYYGWVREGLAVHAALAAAGHPAIEVFPTASWTRWIGPRGSEPRGRWSTRGLAALRLAAVPTRTTQDQRDAIAAAVTAREHSAGQTESFGGEIVVPARGVPARISPAQAVGAPEGT